MQDDLPQDLETQDQSTDNDMEAFFAGISAEVKKAEEIRGKKKQLARTGFSGLKDSKLQAEVDAWEAKQLWRPVAQVLVLTEQTCLCCGHVALSTHSRMIREEYISKPDTIRWTTPAILSQDLTCLPKETAYAPEQVAFCPECMEQEGFSYEGKLLANLLGVAK